MAGALALCGRVDGQCGARGDGRGGDIRLRVHRADPWHLRCLPIWCGLGVGHLLDALCTDSLDWAAAPLRGACIRYDELAGQLREFHGNRAVSDRLLETPMARAAGAACCARASALAVSHGL